MDEIKTPSEFSDLVRTFKKKYGKLVTNCYLMPKEIEQKAQAGKISVYCTEGFLYFLIDELDYYRMYFYLPKDGKIEMEQPDKPVVLDFVQKQGRAVSGQEVLYRLFEDYGFKEHKTYQRMCLNIQENTGWESMNQELPPEYHQGYGKESMSEDMLELWREELDIYSTPLPDEKNLKQDIEAKNIIIVTDKTGHLCAVNSINQYGEACMQQHLAVKREHRRNGLARLLCCKMIEIMKKAGVKKLYLWVDVKNEAALNLYIKCGYQKEGTDSKQFIYNI